MILSICSRLLYLLICDAARGIMMPSFLQSWEKPWGVDMLRKMFKTPLKTGTPHTVIIFWVNSTDLFCWCFSQSILLFILPLQFSCQLHLPLFFFHSLKVFCLGCDENKSWWFFILHHWPFQCHLFCTAQLTQRSLFFKQDASCVVFVLTKRDLHTKYELPCLHGFHLWPLSTSNDLGPPLKSIGSSALPRGTHTLDMRSIWLCFIALHVYKVFTVQPLLTWNNLETAM